MTGITALLAGVGASEGTVSVPDLTVEAETIGGTATASINFLASGDYTSNLGDDIWINPRVGMANYEVRATLTSGVIGSGTFGTWLALTSTRTWSNSRSTLGTTSGTILLEFRRAGGATLDSASITLTATRASS